MTVLTESRPLTEAMPVNQPDGPSRLSVLVINPGWGSSGYYSAEALQEAARDRVFPAGTQMYLDHPTETESWERPERSVRDLAAVLTEDARWDASVPGLVAEARVFAPWRQTIADMADTIGVSIRAAAETEFGEAEGRTGTLITKLLEGYSVDFVTKAGRGGKIVSVHESKVDEARNVGQWLEARVHQSFTNLADEMFGDGKLTRDERIGLSSAIGDALTSFVSKVESAAPQLYTRDLWDDPEDARAAVEATPEDVPSRPAGQSEANESEEDNMAQVSIEESEYTTLKESAGRAEAAKQAVAEAQKAQEKAVADRDAAFKEADKAIAESIVAQADVDFDALQTAGLVTMAPVGESGRLDREAFEKIVAAEAAKIAESKGAGSVRGFGQTVTTESDTEDLSESDLDRELAQLRGRTVKEG